MAAVQSITGSNDPGGREEMFYPPNHDVYKTMAVISTAINELSCTLQQIREQLRGLSSTAEHERSRSNNHVDHFEIFAIAMKEVQSKSSKIEELEQENRALRARLSEGEYGRSSRATSGETPTEIVESRPTNRCTASGVDHARGDTRNTGMISAREKREKVSVVAPHQCTSLDEYVESLVSSNAPNLNGKRPLIPPYIENKAHDNLNTIPDSTNVTNAEVTVASNQKEPVEVDNPDAEVEEIPEPPNGQLNTNASSQGDQASVNEELTGLEEAPEKVTVRHNPARRRRGMRLKSPLEETAGNETRSTRARPSPQDTHSTKPAGDTSLAAERPIGSGFNAADAVEARSEESTIIRPGLADKEDEQLSITITRETHLLPPRQLTKRRRGRPKGSAPEHPMVEIVTSMSPAPNSEKPAISPNIPEDRRTSMNTRKDEEETEQRRKAEIAARELLVQAAMQREEAYML